jgi:diguanylate cyclase (GGDEF)-like protein
MRFIQFKLVGPAVIAMALVLGGMATIPYYAVSQIDAEMRDRQETLVKRNIALWIKDIEFSLTSWTIWDEAIAKIDNRFDREWTDRNIGASLIGTSRTRFSAVLDAEDRLIYSRMDDSVKARPFFARGQDPIIDDAWALIEEIRQNEHGRAVEGIPAQLAVSRIEIVGDDAVLLTAALFQSDFGTSRPKSDRAPILVTAMPITGSLPDFFGTRFLLDDAKVSPSADVPSALARVEIAIDQAGETEVLSWRPPTPAADILDRSLPLIIAVCAFVLAGGLFTLHISRKAARMLLSREQQMRHAATHDFLTGLANRSLLEPQYRAYASAGPLAVVCLDLDGFKQVNDSYGHAVGDELLQAVASRLKSGVRSGDIVFRLGGDEFTILMPGLTTEHADQICRGLCRALSQPVQLSAGQVTVGASFGIEVVINHDTTCDAALGAADAALYRAKSFGRGSVVSHIHKVSAPALGIVRSEKFRAPAADFV